jgi:hypothetical protein
VLAILKSCSCNSAVSTRIFRFSMVSFRYLNGSGVVAAMAGNEVQLPYHTPCTPVCNPLYRAA